MHYLARKNLQNVQGSLFALDLQRRDIAALPMVNYALKDKQKAEPILCMIAGFREQDTRFQAGNGHHECAG